MPGSLGDRHPPSFRMDGPVDTPCDIDLGVIYTGVPGEHRFMRDLLPSLRQSTGRFTARLILVDNCAEDGVDQWAGEFSRTSVVTNQARLGYAANLNRIIARSTAPFVLLLNTDMYFDAGEQCIAKMLRFMYTHPECGLAGCRLYHSDGGYAYPARRFQSLRVIAARRLGMQRLFKRTLSDYLYENHPRENTFECDWLSGCFLLVRREALEAVGGLDERFPKYFEDIDFCLRIALTGWRVLFHGATYCYHLEQRASRRLLSRDAFLHAVSYARWLRKWGFNPEARLRAARATLVSRGIPESQPLDRRDAA